MRAQRLGAFAAALLLFSTGSGCETFEDTQIDPFESQSAYFTLYGFLDATRTDQEIRVIPVRRTPEIILSPSDENAFIDAVLSTTDLETGARVFWRHELTELEDGTYGHIFRSVLAPRPGRSYRVDVTRSDGKASSATTTIPVLSSIFDPVIGDYREEPGRMTQEVHMPGIAIAASIDVLYDVTGGPRTHIFRVTRSYGATGSPADAGGWRFTVDLSRDAHEVRRAAEPVFGDQLALNQMGVRVRWADEQWPVEDDPQDINALAQPSGFTNVENGYGFVGSIGDYLRFWDVEDDEMKAALGFN